MSWSAPATYVNGALIAAADLNLISANLEYLKGQAGVISFEDALELAESAAPSTPASGFGRIFVGNASPRNGIAACIDDAGTIYQMLQHVGATAFTPTYTGTTVAGTTTYSTQDGRYARIGPIIFFWIRVAWTNATGTGNGQVGGLPVSSEATSDAVVTIMSANISYTNGGLRGFIGNGVATIQLFDQVTGGFTSSAIDTAGELILTGHYLAA